MGTWRWVFWCKICILQWGSRAHDSEYEGHFGYNELEVLYVWGIGCHMDGRRTTN